MFSSGKAEARTSGCDSCVVLVPPPPAIVCLARCYHKRCHHKKQYYESSEWIVSRPETFLSQQRPPAFTDRRGHVQDANADPDDHWGVTLPASPRLAPAKPLPSMLPMLCYDVQWCRPIRPTKNELRAGMVRCALTPPTLSDADDARRHTRQTGDSISKLSVASSKSPDGSLWGRAHVRLWMVRGGGRTRDHRRHASFRLGSRWTWPR
jgi:hypothetical protein